MNTLEEYLTAIKPQIDSAVNYALPRLAEELIKSLDDAATEEVYSYEASPEAMEVRRYSIASEDNMEIIPGNYEVEIENGAVMQSGEANEVKMVEEGWGGKYRQPGPRPFMQQGLDRFIDSGMGEDMLASALRGAGFTVV